METKNIFSPCLILVISPFLLAIFKSTVNAVEQRLIIELGKGIRGEENLPFSENKYGSNGYNDRTNSGGRRGAEIGGYRLTTTANRNQLQQSSLLNNYANPTANREKTSIAELQSLIRQMELYFNDRIDELTKKVNRLEANQNSFRRSVMAEWQALSSIDNKRIRFFTSTMSTWQEAVSICEANTGQLLHIESAEENRQIIELLRNITSSSEDVLFWIDTQTTFTFNFPSGKFNKFENETPKSNNSGPNDDVTNMRDDNSAEQYDDNKSGVKRNHESSRNFQWGCAAVSTAHNGKWVNRNCLERHPFICQL